MAANVDPNKSTMASFSAQIPSGEELPVVEVFKTSDGVVLKWGEGGAQQTTAGVDASYTTDSFHAVDSNGDEPFRKTFGTLLGCHNGVLTIGRTPYRIRVIRVDTQLQQPPDVVHRDRAIDPPPMKKLRFTPACSDTQIKKGVAVRIPIQELEILNPNKMEEVMYYGREGIDELFSELVDSKLNKKKFNITLIGHPGAGKSNLAWAIAHHIASTTKASILWASRRDAEETWSLRLFEWCTEDDCAKIYELEDSPSELRDILNETLLKDLKVLILDAPTCAKSTCPPSKDGVAAFEWAGKQNRIGERRVLHTSSLRAFSLDDRILSRFNLEIKTMRPWTRQDFIKSLSEDKLKQQVCDTLGLNPKEKSAEDIVDAKLYYSGINARWFFNSSIDEIKENCQGIIRRMSSESSTVGISHERAVNSAYVTVWDGDREIKLFTSRYLVGLLGNHLDYQKKFFELYPMMKDRLGNGAPGEIFEADFLMNLEHSHAIAAAQRYVMGDMAEKVAVVIGKDSKSGETVHWLTGRLTSLPKNPSKTGAQPMPFSKSNIKRIPQWLVPEDPNQPFLDFFALFPVPDTSEWELRVIQNTVSKQHSTNLDHLKLIVIGVVKSGFDLASTIKVCFVIEEVDQASVGSAIQGSCIVIPAKGNSKATRSRGSPIKGFTLEVSHVLFKRTAPA